MIQGSDKTMWKFFPGVWKFENHSSKGTKSRHSMLVTSGIAKGVGKYTARVPHLGGGGNRLTTNLHIWQWTQDWKVIFWGSACVSEGLLEAFEKPILIGFRSLGKDNGGVMLHFLPPHPRCFSYNTDDNKLAIKRGTNHKQMIPQTHQTWA